MSDRNCNECGGRITLSVVDTEQEMKTEKAPVTGDIRELGERVKVRLGLACECTTYRGHALSHRGLERGSFEESPERFPDNWVDS